MNYVQNNQFKPHKCSCKYCEVDVKTNWAELTLKQKLEMYGVKKLRYLAIEKNCDSHVGKNKEQLIALLLYKGVTEKDLPIKITNTKLFESL